MPVIAENVNLQLHGQIGKQWIYWMSNNTQYKRIYKIPLDPKTFAQRTQRNKFFVASKMWLELTTEQKNTWEEKVKKRQVVMSGYNYYMQKKIKEIKQMIKKITHGNILISDGVNVITILEIDLDKTALNYNCFLAGDYQAPQNRFGIIRAFLDTPTTIKAIGVDPTPLGGLWFTYQIIEYV